MTIRDTERVGIFTESIVSKEVQGFPGKCLTVGVIAQVDKNVYKHTDLKAFSIQNYEEAQNKFGKESEMSRLVNILTLSGVNKIICVPVIVSGQSATNEEYQKALEVLYGEEAVKIVICDSTESEIHKLVKNHCEKASANRRERRGHLGVKKDLKGSELTSLASALNSGRVSLWASIPLKNDGSAYNDSSYIAAACAAQDSLELDPAMPIHNVQIPMSLFGGLYNKYDEDEYENLYNKGIAACRSVSGNIFIDRWVTTYIRNDTVNPPVEDDKYKEGTVSKIKDFIDEGLRERLSTLHPRVKASMQSMKEIKADALNWLKQQEEKQVIENPRIIKIERQADKRSRFHVYYSYEVVLPLNTIFIHGIALV